MRSVKGSQLRESYHLTYIYQGAIVCAQEVCEVSETYQTRPSLTNWNRGYALVNHSQIWPRERFPYLEKFDSKMELAKV